MVFNFQGCNIFWQKCIIFFNNFNSHRFSHVFFLFCCSRHFTPSHPIFLGAFRVHICCKDLISRCCLVGCKASYWALRPWWQHRGVCQGPVLKQETAFRLAKTCRNKNIIEIKQCGRNAFKKTTAPCFRSLLCVCCVRYGLDLSFSERCPMVFWKSLDMVFKQNKWSLKTRCYPPWNQHFRLWKWMVGRRSLINFNFGMAILGRCHVIFWEDKL